MNQTANANAQALSPNALDANSTDEPFAAMRDLHTSLRNDLQITRQLTRNVPVYVVYDPVNFKAHRLGLTDYQVVALLSTDRTLDACFAQAVQAGILTSQEEADFYRFVAKLDLLGLLTSSKRNSKALYQKFLSRTAAEKKNKLLGFLFLTIPLANPDKFLGRTVRFVDCLFTRNAFLATLVAGFVACAIAIGRWTEFVQPLNNILAIKNLVFMSVAFLALKVWHEFGHGYACKKFGGRVPEMGCKLIAGMPLAYVDATSAWSFPRKTHRLIVMLGGIYFESLIAIPALFLWAWSPTSLLGSFAYQLVFMAGVATVFFNANPLMRFDGYFVFSDLIGIPNLRARATAEVASTLKYFALGLPHASPPSNADRTILLTYGIASSIYMTFLMVSISLLLATRFGLIGLALGAFQLGTMMIKFTRTLFGFLLNSDETRPCRARARKFAYGIGIGVPLALLVAPVPTSVRVPGVVTAQSEVVVRAGASGTISKILDPSQIKIAGGSSLIELQNVDTLAHSQAAALTADAAARQANWARRTDNAEGAKLELAAAAERARFDIATQDAERLIVRAPHDGKLVYLIPDRQLGRFVEVGEPIAKLVAGETLVRAWLDEQQLAAAQLSIGTQVEVALADASGTHHQGVIQSVDLATEDEFQDLMLTTVADGGIAYDPASKKTHKTLVRMLVQLPEIPADSTLHGARAQLLIPRNYETLGAWLVRSSQQFINRILTN